MDMQTSQNYSHYTLSFFELIDGVNHDTGEEIYPPYCECIFRFDFVDFDEAAEKLSWMTNGFDEGEVACAIDEIMGFQDSDKEILEIFESNFHIEVTKSQ
jgi:hypothetical protein